MFGCNKFCNFENYGIAKIVVFLEFYQLHSGLLSFFFSKPWICASLLYKTTVFDTMSFQNYNIQIVCVEIFRNIYFFSNEKAVRIGF